MGKDPDTPWTEDERRRFATVYYQFRSAYEAHGGKRLSTTVGDAMLACMRVYGYQDLLSISETEMKQSMEKAWEEIILQQEERPIALSLVPEEKKRTGLLSMVLPSGTPRELKAAFINDKSPDTSGWTLAHELGASLRPAGLPGAGRYHRIPQRSGRRSGAGDRAGHRRRQHRDLHHLVPGCSRPACGWLWSIRRSPS